MKTARAALLACLLAVLGASCVGDESKPGPAKLWTVEDFQTFARAGKPLPAGLGQSPVVLSGEPLPLLSPPYSDTVTRQRAGQDGLQIFPAFSEGEPAAYTTTEIWQGFPAIWLQPLYLFVTGFSNGAAQVVAESKVVFGVDVTTRFYSPYWQVIYVIVPPGTTAADLIRLRSAEAVLSSGFQLIEGAGTFCVLVPTRVLSADTSAPAVEIGVPEGATQPVRPLLGGSVPATANFGFVNGHRVDYIDFGRNRFTWNDKQVIDEAALFDLVIRGADGSRRSLGVPRIGGTGPLGSNTPARITNGKPQFGGLWKLYTAPIPPGAAVFIPRTRPALIATVLAAAGQADAPAGTGVVPAVDPQIEARADVNKYLLRVAANPACFRDPASFPQTCRWLDSQAAVEREVLAGLIAETGFYVTCPFLAFLDAPVTNQ